MVSEGLILIDWVIIGIYAALTLFLGWYFGRRQKSTSEYFTGSGHMSPILIGVSLFASFRLTRVNRPAKTIGSRKYVIMRVIAPREGRCNLGGVSAAKFRAEVR